MKPFKAFLFLCRCISFEGDDAKQASRLRREIAAGNADWEMIIKIADRHFALPFLYQRLIEKNLLQYLPSNKRFFLKTIFELNLSRNRLHKKQVFEIARLFNAIDVEPLLLKGSAALFSGLYASDGGRMMNDLDLLVPYPKLESCIRTLFESGYRLMRDEDLPDQYHAYLPLVHEKYLTRIEIHKYPIKLNYSSILNTNEIWEKSTPLIFQNARLRIPDYQHFILHNIIHSQLSHRGNKKNKIYLYQMLDLVMLRRNLDKKIDWYDIKNRFEKAGYIHPFLSYLVIASNLFKQHVPDQICSRLKAAIIWHVFEVLCNYPMVNHLRNAIYSYIENIRVACGDPTERRILLKKFLKTNTYRKNIILFFKNINHSCFTNNKPFI